ncbi:MAG: branched-chain amino acid ABC transporter permease, partial [Candidatus Bipolaricaulia bacterium]
LAIVIGTTAIGVSSLDLLYGYAGLPSLAQGAFFGIGAYTSAVLTMNISNSVFLALAGGAVVTGIIGVLVGLVGIRTGRHWTSFTFISTIIFTISFMNFEVFTGGPSGLSGVPHLSLGVPVSRGILFNPFLNKNAYYFLVVLVLFCLLWLKHLAVKSWFGRSIKAIREDEGLARSVGIPSRRYKVAVFGFSAAVAGVGGSLYAHYVTYLHPDLFNFVKSFRFLMMNRIGGLGSLVGPVLGSGFVRAVEELTRPL